MLNLYDLFLIDDRTGQVLYTVEKEADFAMRYPAVDINPILQTSKATIDPCSGVSAASCAGV